uniref:CST complex subunit STN1 n=1 Tax=Cyprinus carpio carpio TaxID=630221 RepID=A0A8C1A0B1_CYPCA
MVLSLADADADEVLSVLWGLDPVFSSAYSRLYITRVYFYKTHPLFQVDVLGTVVYKQEREDFYCYGDELKRLKEAERKSTVLEIGDLLSVRGTVKTSRDAREIRATSFYKVNDPMMAVLISRMLEMPQLYRKCHDQPFRDLGVLALKEFLLEKEVARFHPYGVEFLLHPLIQSSSAEQTLSILQDEGQIFRKMQTPDEVYNVTKQDKDLHKAIKDILREDTKREKYAEKGCHVLHILSSQNLSREVLEVTLTFLERNSDISTTEAHYTVLLHCVLIPENIIRMLKTIRHIANKLQNPVLFKSLKSLSSIIYLFNNLFFFFFLLVFLLS